jgi:hypothetical protein
MAKFGLSSYNSGNAVGNTNQIKLFLELLTQTDKIPSKHRAGRDDLPIMHGVQRAHGQTAN